MKKFGPSIKFSRLDDDIQDEVQGGFPRLHAQNGEQRDVMMKSSPSRSKRVLQSVACVTGSPKRIPLDDDDEFESLQLVSKTKTTSKAAKDSNRQSRGPPSKQRSRVKVNNSTDETIDGESVTRRAPPPAAVPQNDKSHEQHEAPLRQRQLDDAMQSILSCSEVEPPAQQYEDVGLKIQPTYDDAHIVFQSPSSDAGGTDVSRGSKGKASTRNATLEGRRSKVKPKPAKPVVLDDDNNGEAIVDPPEISRSTAVVAPSQEDSYSDVEALIARVKRLDAVVKAGDEEEAARSVVNEEEAVVVVAGEGDTEQVETNDCVIQKEETDKLPVAVVEPIASPRYDSPPRRRKVAENMTSDVSAGEKERREEETAQHLQVTNEPRAAAVKPVVSPSPHDSPSRQEKSVDAVTSSASADEKKAIDDGSEHFQVIYRRGREHSPVNSHVKTSVATASSIVTMSSFGIPGVPMVQKAAAIVTPVHHRPRSTHPFFWRTHPKEIFTSYAPNRPKTMLAPLQGGEKRTLSNRVTSSAAPTISRSARMRTVEEFGENGEQKYETRYRATNPYTFWSKERDPVDDEASVLEDGAADFSPYGEQTVVSAHWTTSAPLSPANSEEQPTPSPSNTWVAFSEFSVDSVESFNDG